VLSLIYKNRLFKQLLIGALLILLLIPTTSVGENTTTDSIKIDGHLIYIFQQDDLRTFYVNEYFIINNTGKSAFNDSFYIWIQNNSIILADCCNYTLNMASRYDERGCKECFYLDKTDDNNLYVGYPILSENRLSYYGQRESISINVFSTTNASLNKDTLKLNATIGGSSIHREQKNFQGTGLHLTSESLDIGMLQEIDPYMSFNITTIENITLLNNGSDPEVIGFNISDLPQGWYAEIWNDTIKINNVSLSPQEYANLKLIIKAPSNLASIYVGYSTQVGLEGDETKGSFIKKYICDTEKVTYEVFLLTIDELEVSEDLKMVHDELFWREEYGRYWFIAKNDEVLPNSYTVISMKLEKTVGDQPNPYIIWILVIIVILIIGILLLKKIDFFKEKVILKKLNNSKKKEDRIKELEKQKEKVLSAIKRVEREFEDEIINKEDYERLRAAYKKRAVEILKEIDRLKD
jgi:hypothetical protein